MITVKEAPPKRSREGGLPVETDRVPSAQEIRAVVVDEIVARFSQIEGKQVNDILGLPRHASEKEKKEALAEFLAAAQRMTDVPASARQNLHTLVKVFGVGQEVSLPNFGPERPATTNSRVPNSGCLNPSPGTGVGIVNPPLGPVTGLGIVNQPPNTPTTNPWQGPGGGVPPSGKPSSFGPLLRGSIQTAATLGCMYVGGLIMENYTAGLVPGTTSGKLFQFFGTHGGHAFASSIGTLLGAAGAGLYIGARYMQFLYTVVKPVEGLTPNLAAVAEEAGKQSQDFIRRLARWHRLVEHGREAVNWLRRMFPLDPVSLAQGHNNRAAQNIGLPFGSQEYKRLATVNEGKITEHNYLEQLPPFYKLDGMTRAVATVLGGSAGMRNREINRLFGIVLTKFYEVHKFLADHGNLNSNVVLSEVSNHFDGIQKLVKNGRYQWAVMAANYGPMIATTVTIGGYNLFRVAATASDLYLNTNISSHLPAFPL